MRLLVTNTQTAQAYTIIQCLRPYAERIVATTDRRACYAAHSKDVDARYTAPSPDIDWQRGVIQEANTEAEARYLARLIEISKRERIDMIFPSRDPHVYVCAKNKTVLAEHGIFAPVPDFAVLRDVIDKRRSLILAQQAGFPCPKTIMTGGDEPDETLFARAREFGPPWVIKPRMSAGSAGMSIVTDAAALPEKFAFVRARYQDPMIQELVPGGKRQNFYVVVNGEGKPHCVLCPKIQRQSLRLYRDSTASCLSATEHPFLPQVRALVERLGWHGPLSIQTMVDPRDGAPKLMEINPGVRAHAWYSVALGINVPLMAIQAARGEELPAIGTMPTDTLFLDPVMDLTGIATEFADRLIYLIKTKLLGRSPTDPRNPPATIATTVRAYLRDYFSAHPKAYSPLFAGLLNDPKPCLIFGCLQALYAFHNLRKVGG